MANLNSKWINLTFIIDESGSMYSSKEDVIGGFKKTIDEQKAIKDGKVTVSLYKFSDAVSEIYLGKDINDIGEFEYRPNGMTAMNDGIGKAIDNVGKWLYEKDKKGEEMPGVNLVVVMTDGMENSSKEYKLKQVQEMIKLQTETYNWQFIYMGSDITTSKAADELGFKFKTYGSRDKLLKNYDIVNSVTSTWRGMANTGASLDTSTSAFCSILYEEAEKNTKEYESELGHKISTT